MFFSVLCLLCIFARLFMCALWLLSDQFKNIIKRYKRVGSNMDIMHQSAYLVVNPITVDSFNCTTVGQASVLMMALA